MLYSFSLNMFHFLFFFFFFVSQVQRTWWWRSHGQRQKTDDSDPGLSPPLPKQTHPLSRPVHDSQQHPTPQTNTHTDELRRRGAPAGGRGGGDAAFASYILPLPHLLTAPGMHSSGSLWAVALAIRQSVNTLTNWVIVGFLFIFCGGIEGWFLLGSVRVEVSGSVTSAAVTEADLFDSWPEAKRSDNRVRGDGWQVFLLLKALPLVSGFSCCALFC